jgi:threonine aldolase
MVDRLAEDHATARQLAEGLAEIPGFQLNLAQVQTNMAFFTLAEPLVGHFAPFMADRGIILDDGPYTIRAVTHYGIGPAEIEQVLEAARAFSGEFMS